MTAAPRRRCDGFEFDQEGKIETEHVEFAGYAGHVPIDGCRERTMRAVP